MEITDYSERLALMDNSIERLNTFSDKYLEKRDRQIEEQYSKLPKAVMEDTEDKPLTAKQIKALQEENARLKAENEALVPVDTSLQARAATRRSLKQIQKDLKAEQAKVKTFSRIEQAKKRYKSN